MKFVQLGILGLVFRDSAGKEWMTPSADIMKAGETVELDVSDTESVRIRVGRPKSTEIYVNGELLEYGVPPQILFHKILLLNTRKNNSHLLQMTIFFERKGVLL